MKKTMTVVLVAALFVFGLGQVAFAAPEPNPGTPVSCAHANPDHAIDNVHRNDNANENFNRGLCGGE